MEYVSGAKIKEQYQVSAASLRKWGDEGRVRVIRTPGGKRLFHLKDINKLLGNEEEVKIKGKVCYARVSTQDQREELKSQIEELKVNYPDHRIIKDIGSGVNFKRKGLETLLELCCSQAIDEVVVTYKDRLCRFGIELLELIFKKSGVKLVVLSQEDKELQPSNEQEVAKDLFEFITVFVAKNKGLGSGANRKARIKSGKGKVISKSRSEEDY